MILNLVEQRIFDVAIILYIYAVLVGASDAQIPILQTSVPVNYKL